MKNPSFEKYVHEIISIYSPKLLLQRNTWKLNYGVENDNSLMECRNNYPYLNVTLNYSDKIVDIWKKGEDCLPFIIHEMCHPITDPLFNKATNRYVGRDELRDERELLTDYICNIIVKNLL